MAETGAKYRLKAADMLAQAEQNELYREDFEKLARSFLRLADLADRNAQMDPLGDSETKETENSESHQQEPPHQD